MKRNIFKVEVVNENGVIIVRPYSNIQLGILPYMFNNAIQDVVEQINHKADWKRKYIHFNDNGTKYKQIDKLFGSGPCVGCVFNEHGCQHPHYEDRTKGNCEDKIYIKE